MLAPEHYGHAGYKADHDPARRTNPLVVEGVFQKVGGADQERKDPDAIQPMSANFGFQLGFGIGPDFRRHPHPRGLLDLALTAQIGF